MKKITIDDSVPITTFRELKTGQAFYFLSVYKWGIREKRYKVSIHKYADNPDGYRKRPTSRETYVVVVQ